MGAVVSFQDEQGTVWSIQEDAEGIDFVSRPHDFRPRAVRLRFVSELEERTLHDYPDDWSRLERHQLQSLLHRASPDVVRFPRRSPVRNVEPDRG